MTTECSRPILPPPQVNAKATARVVLENAESMLSRLATAGASNAIVEHPSAWQVYAADTGLLGFNLAGDPSELGMSGSEEMTFAIRPEPGEDEQTGVQTTVIGATAPPRGNWLAFEPVNVEPVTAYGSARRHADRSREAALADVRRRLDHSKAAYAQKSPGEVVTALGDELGVSQLVTARAVGVTPTAVRKWRRGEPARSEHRDRLSQLAALCSLLTEVGLHDPAGWIDIPISGDSTLTPLDLFAGRHADLIVLLGAGLADPQETLDEFDPSWRTTFAPDRDYEVVTLADGSRSVVPRRDASG